MIEIRDMDPKDCQASSAGVTLALQDAIRALVKSHPNLDAVAQAMRREREESIALLLGKGYPDRTVDAYRDTFDAIRPHVAGEDMSPP